jgi:hypothetical protein
MSNWIELMKAPLSELREMSAGTLKTSNTIPGIIPAGLPGKLTVGLFEDLGLMWMAASKLPWDLRYRYLTMDGVNGWSNNWGWWPRDGAFAGAFFTETAQHGFIPVVSYYCLFGTPLRTMKG